MGGAEWEFSDAWLLIASRHGGRRGRDLRSLIAVADAYNHDIPTEGAIERSIGRLIASGLATGSGDLRVRLTRDGMALAKRVRRLGMFEQAPMLQTLLRSTPLVEGHWPLPPGAWQDAYDRYYPPERRGGGPA